MASGAQSGGARIKRRRIRHYLVFFVAVIVAVFVAIAGAGLVAIAPHGCLRDFCFVVLVLDAVG